MPRLAKDLRPPYGEESFRKAAAEVGDAYLKQLFEAAVAWAALGERWILFRQQNTSSARRCRRRAKEANA